ncbi:MAG: SLC13 family permease [Pseudomonadota bacterium]|nr:SLC13 family permease [Pseudomonadota bacterium]
MDSMLVAGFEHFHLWAGFAMIAAAIVLFTIDRIPLEVSAVGILAILLLFFHVFPVAGSDGDNRLDAAKLLAGFANPVLCALLSLLVIGQGLSHTGAVELLTGLVSRLTRLAPKAGIALALLMAGGISAFLNNTPVVVIFIPILTAVATRLGRTPAHVLMPLSFITILGGMVTLIGSSANLIAASVAEAAGATKIGFFDFTVPGLVLAGIGALYVVFVMPRILGRFGRAPTTIRREAAKQFLAQITLVEGHPWIGVTASAGLFPELKNLTVRLVRRGAERMTPPFDGLTLQEGDTVLIAATRDVLAAAVAQHRPKGATAGDEAGAPLIMAEAVIPPGSPFLGRTARQARLNDETGCTIVGIERRSRMMRLPMDQIVLAEGDVLLMIGSAEAIRNLRDNHDILLLARSRAELPVPHHARRALLIFAATIAAAATGLLPIAVATLAGAVAMIVFGCLNLNQAAAAFDRTIYILVGVAFALAAVLQETGGAKSIAHGVVALFADLGPAALLSALFLLTALLTNFLSNHATAALVAPIAVSAAAEIGVDPAPFIYGIIFGLNCSFATPIGYQTNLLVMGPGHYRFGDFAIAGLPLILLLWLAYSLFAPVWYGL